MGMISRTYFTVCKSISSRISYNFGSKRPVIGIFAQPSHFEGYPEDKKQYVLGANIEWIEMSGAKSIVIPFDESPEFYSELVQSINGVLFTGGNLNINIDVPLKHYPTIDGKNLWTKNASYLLESAVKQNKDGTFFPVWGNCQGFQLLQYFASGYNYKILQHITNDQNTIRTIKIKETEISAKFFKQLSPGLLKYAQNIPAAFYYHELGVTTADYAKCSKLNEFFEIVATSVNANSPDNPDATPYVSIIRGKVYPFLGVQFHPEYMIFESDAFETNFSQDSLAFNTFFSQKFVEMSQRNSNTFSPENQLKKKLNLYPELVHVDSSVFSRIAFIDRKS